MGRNRSVVGLVTALFMLLALTVGDVATAHTKKWKTGVLARSPFPGEVSGAVNSAQRACRAGRKVRLVHKDGQTGTTTRAGAAVTPKDGSYAIAPTVASVPGDTWVIRVLSKVVRKNDRHLHLCLPRRTTVPAADVTTITSADGSAVLQIPKGAVDETALDDITVERIADPATIPVRYRGTVDNFGDDPDPDVNEPPVAGWRLQPDGLTFAEPARLTVTGDDFPASVAPFLVPGDDTGSDDLEEVEIVDLSQDPDGATEVSLAIEHFTDLSLLPRGQIVTGAMPTPQDGEEFDVGQTFTWTAEVTVDDNVVEVFDELNSLDFDRSRRLFRRADITDGWRMKVSFEKLVWGGAVSGEKEIPDQLVNSSTFKTKGQAMCEQPGTGELDSLATAFWPYQYQYFRINGDGSTGGLLHDRRSAGAVGFYAPLSKRVTCVASAAATTPVTVTQTGFTFQENAGFHFHGGPLVVVDQSNTWDVIYVGTWAGSGSVEFLTVYGGQNGSIPAIGDGGEVPLRAIHDLFVDNITDQPDGPPVADWPAIFEGLDANGANVGGSLIELNLDPDRGGVLPGFDAQGVLPETSGPHTCQHGACQNYTITLLGEIAHD